MAKQQHWVDRVMEDVKASILRDKTAMRAAVGRPVRRRPNTADILASALQHPDPASLPPVGRERLGQWARERYGEAATLLFPGLGLDPDGKDMMANGYSTATPYADPAGADAYPAAPGG